jgi:hypothetical protein
MPTLVDLCDGVSISVVIRYRIILDKTFLLFYHDGSILSNICFNNRQLWMNLITNTHNILEYFKKMKHSLF